MPTLCHWSTTIPLRIQALTRRTVPTVCHWLPTAVACVSLRPWHHSCGLALLHKKHLARNLLCLALVNHLSQRRIPEGKRTLSVGLRRWNDASTPA